MMITANHGHLRQVGDQDYDESHLNDLRHLQESPWPEDRAALARIPAIYAAPHHAGEQGQERTKS